MDEADRAATVPAVADITYAWRGPVDNDAVNGLHAEAFEHRVFDDDWAALTAQHSMGWVTAHDSEGLVGFTNVVWDGLTHAWIQDVMVAGRRRGEGVGPAMVAMVVERTRDAGLEWLHVDFDDDLAPFYLEACGFTEARAGLIQL